MSIFKNYPRGVFALSTIEMWERFSFYSMQSILVLYAVAATTKGGMGWTNAEALRLTGLYGSLVYASPILGGLVADKLLGKKRAVIIGAIIMMCGHGILAISTHVISLYTALLFLIIGCGLMKPSISAMVGDFYGKHEEANKEAGFAVFYMSINIGALAGSLLSGVVAGKFGYSIAFGMAAVGLVIAIVSYLLTRNKSLANVGSLNNDNSKNDKKHSWTRADYKRLYAFLTLCVCSIFWFVIYGLPYGLLTLYADKNISRTVLGFEIPATWFFAMYGGVIIIAAPIVSIMYEFIATKTKFNFTMSYKITLSYTFLAIAALFVLPLVTQISINSHYVGSCWYLILFYVFFALSELFILPVLLSAATTFAPEGYSATFVSLNLCISWAIGAYLGGEFGALTQSINPALMFKGVIGLSIVFALGHLFSNKKIENIIDAK